MKTIYNVKALCVVALLGSAAAASAQEDVTKEKNLNREMTLHNSCCNLYTNNYLSLIFSQLLQ